MKFKTVTVIKNVYQFNFSSYIVLEMVSGILLTTHFVDFGHETVNSV